MKPLLLLLAMGFGADETSPAAEEFESQVRQLMRDLDAAELATRDGAETRLLELGIRALPLLPEPNDDLGAEVRQRLTRIRHKLQQLAAQSSLAPSRVSLNVKNEPLSKVLRSIQEQTGNKLYSYRGRRGQPENDPQVSLEISELPFWEALDKTLDAARATLYPFSEEEPDALGVIDLPEGQTPRGARPVGYSGAFRFEARRVASEIEFESSATRTLELEVDMSWEPRMRPISLLHQLGAASARDEHDNELSMANRLDVQEINPAVGEHTRTMHLRLGLPPRTSQRIASLKGKLTVLMPGKYETFSWNDFRKANQAVRNADAVVTLESVKRQDEVWIARVRVKFDNADGALQSHLDWVDGNEAWLVDPAGKRIEPDTREPTRRTEDEAGMAYVFGLETKSIKGYELHYKTPVQITPVDVEYELKDLPLP